MALTKKKTTKTDGSVEEVEEVVEITEEEATDVDTNVEVTSVEEVDTASNLDPNVKIKVRDNHRSYIGDRHYDFQKGVVYTVPSNVKRVLQEADLLEPIN